MALTDNSSSSSNSSNNDDCIFNYQIEDLVLNMNKVQLQDYECQVCLELMKYNQEMYQCVNGHLGCKDCWRTILEGDNKSCMNCKVEIRSLTDGLSRCRPIESSFNHIQVYCPYSFTAESFVNKPNEPKSELIKDGSGNCCDKVIKVEELDNHVKNCQFRFIKCSNGCNEISRANQDHQSVCPDAMVECELCKLKLKRSELSNHTQNTCPSSSIKCQYCPVELKRLEVAQHHSSACPNITIPCTFEEYGCHHQMKRVELSSHLEQVNHSSFMVSLIKKVNQNYNNQWIISNFLDKLEKKVTIYSPIFNVNEFQFKLSFGHDNVNKDIRVYLQVINYSIYSTLSIDCTFKLLNSKDPNKITKFTMFQEYSKKDPRGWGNTFGDSVQFTKDSGYIFYDDSIRLDITINIKKPPLQS